MKTLECLGVAVLLTVAVASSAQAESKRLIYERSRMGTSWKVYLLDKKSVKQVEIGGETRRLYLANLETDNDRDGISRQTTLVQCSTSAPFVAFKSSDSSSGLAIIHYINPGGNWFGASVGSHWEYWAVCHNVWNAQRMNDADLATKARQLGYSTELQSQQLEIPYEVMQSLK